MNKRVIIVLDIFEKVDGFKEEVKTGRRGQE
jgi:hypothetical protein